MDKIWFTSDTHFGEQRTLELSKRPFATVREMDIAIMSNWNNVVAKNDTVYHLGDFGNFDNAQYLNGNIILISGNYDDKFTDEEILNSGIKEVIRSDCYGVIIDWVDIYMSHYPSLAIEQLTYTNSFNLFGHIHKLQMVKRNGLNVGIDCHNFYPIDFETVMFYRKAIRNFYDEEVFC